MHGDDVVIFMLFLVDLLVGDEPVQGLEGVAAEVREACFMRE